MQTHKYKYIELFLNIRQYISTPKRETQQWDQRMQDVSNYIDMYRTNPIQN